MRVRRRWLTTSALAGAVLLGMAGPAAAHTSLERSVPAADSLVAAPPTEVTLYFDEAVGTALGAVKVIAPSGVRADQNRLVGDGRVVHVPLQSGLAAGTYVVVWRVTSDDGHAASGRFSFSIGHPSAAAEVDAASGAPASTRRLAALGRFVAYGGFVLLAGGLILAALVWSAGAGDARLRRLVTTGWGLVVGGTLLTLLMQGPSSAALGPINTFTQPHLLVDVAQTRFGELHIARIAALLALTPSGGLSLASHTSRPRASRLGVAAVLSLLALTWSAAGHASVKNHAALWIGIDVLHMLAAATWLGGLVAVLAALLRSPDAARALPAWSRLAFGAVVVLVASGTANAFREIRSWDALWHARYGELVLAKAGIVAVMVGVGGLSRWILRRRLIDQLALSVRLEAALGVGVLVLTAALVATPPARTGAIRPLGQAASSSAIAFSMPVVRTSRSGVLSASAVTPKKSTPSYDVTATPVRSRSAIGTNG
jgi:copper transport protein